MIELGIIFIMIVALLVVGLILLSLGNSSRSQTLPSTTFEDSNFTPTQMYLDNAGGVGIALNESTKTLCMIQSSTLPPRLLHFTDIVASFVLKNNSIIHKTLRSNPKEFAIMAKEMQGRLALGAGQDSTHPNPKDQTQKIDLHLVIHDQEHPIHTVNFLDMDAKEGGVIYEKAMVSAKHWHHLMSDLIQQANTKYVDSEETHQIQSNNHPQVPSVADELAKLSELLDQNVITQTDFDTQKEKLLARQ